MEEQASLEQEHPNKGKKVKMGGFQSKAKSQELTPYSGDNHPQLPPPPSRDAILHTPADDLNVSLFDTSQVLDTDNMWLDESEMLAQEDEDRKLSRDCEASGLSLESWLAMIPVTNIEIHITEHELVKKFLGAASTVEYTIVSSRGTVRRRYRDFVHLRWGLEIRYPGSVVPPIPSSKQFGKTDPDFVVERQRLLMRFLQALLLNAYFSAEDLTEEFLASKKKFDRKTALFPRQKLMKSHALSLSSKRWSQALCAQQDAVANPVFVSDRAMQELENVKRELVRVRNLCRTGRLKFQTMASFGMEMSQAFQQTLETENKLAVYQSGSGLRALLGSVSNAYGEQANIVTESNARMEELLYTALVFELLFVDVHMEQLKHTKQSLVKLRNAAFAYKQLKDSPEMVSFKQTNTAMIPSAGDPEGFDHPAAVGGDHPGKAKLCKLREQAVQAQMVARRYINGVLKLDLDRFSVERTMRLQQSLLAYCKSRWEQASHEAALWARFHSPDNNFEASVEAVLTRPLSGLPPPPMPPPTENPFASSAGEEVAGNPFAAPKSLVARYSYQSMQEDELDVLEGDELTGKVDEANPQWYKARNLKNGKEGLVPVSYLEEKTTEARTWGADEEYDSDDDEDTRKQQASYGTKRSQRNLDEGV